jgi:hypothetical protein
VERSDLGRYIAVDHGDLLQKKQPDLAASCAEYFVPLYHIEGRTWRES